MAAGDALLGEEAAWAGYDEEERRVGRFTQCTALAFILALSAAFGGLAAASAARGPLPEPHPLRAAAECALAAGMLVELFVDTFLYPGVTRDLEIFAIMRLAGKVPFLTTWILYCQSIEMVASAAGEVLLLAGVPCPRLMTASYGLAVFASCIGIMLTLLFLRFNYFEEKWRTELAAKWQRRGYAFFTLSLLGHVPSLPVAVLDVTLVRDGRFLRLCNPSLPENLGLALAFAASWYAFIHLLWWATSYRSWPYPFLHDFDTLFKRLAFFAVVFAVLAIVMLPIQLLAA